MPEEILQRLQVLEDYCFTQNNKFQENVWNNLLLKLESPEGLGIGQRLSKDEPFLIKLTSFNKGFRLPIMTKDQRNLIINPLIINDASFIGLMIYQSDHKPGIRTYNGTDWIAYTENVDN